MSQNPNSLSATAVAFLETITRDPQLENAWLSASQLMEELAAESIEGNAGARTPAEELANVHSHAQDERRHAALLRSMRTIPHFETPAELALEKRFRDIAASFVLGYFGNPVLQEAKNKHAAYVHGALTIEQFPFQVYTHYQKLSSIPAVRELLPSVIADEHDHLKLGRRLVAALGEDERLSVHQLQEIEKEMAIIYLRRLHEVALEHQRKNRESAPERFEEVIGRDQRALVAWVHCLGEAEGSAASHMQSIFQLRALPAPAYMAEHVSDEERHQRLIQRSVLLQRRRFRSDASYGKLESAFQASLQLYLRSLFAFLLKADLSPHLVYAYGALALESRVFKHYSTFVSHCDDVGAAHTLKRVLADETTHMETIQSYLRNLEGFDPQFLQSVRQKEAGFFARAEQKALAALKKYPAESA